MTRAKLEVHEHSCPRTARRVTHSHQGGDRPHDHQGLGPASYTIDKDDWARATGLRGGGRKRFTASPSGLQMEQRDLTEDELVYDIVVCGRRRAEAHGVGALPARLYFTHGLRPASEES